MQEIGSSSLPAPTDVPSIDLELETIVKSSLETLSATRVRLTVEVPPEDLRPALDAAYKKIAAQVNIPGFRRGKVPASIIERRFGRAVVLEEALNDAIPSAYQAAVEEHAVRALGQPDVNIEQDLTELGDDEVVSFTAEVDVQPAIELPQYKGRPVQVADAEVTEDDVEEQLTELRSRFATVTPVDRAVADGDLVVVDVSGEIDGEAREEFSGTGMTFEVGGGSAIDGFDDAVLGASADDVVSFTHEPSQGDFEGQQVELTVTVKAVRQRELPDADDDFAQLASEFDTLDELRDDLRERLSRVKLVEQGIEARDKLAEELLEEAEVPVPEGLLAQLVEQHFSDGHGDDAHREEFINDTKRTLRQQFLLDAVADAEGVEVSQDDIGQWLMQQAPRYNMTPDQFLQALIQADQLGSALGDVRRGKALSLVLENAEITDASGRVVDLKLLDAEDSDAEELEADVATAAEELAAEEAEAAAAVVEDEATEDEATEDEATEDDKS